MCKLLGQHLLHFRWKLSEIRNLDFFSRMKSKEVFFFFSSEEGPFPSFFASLMESPWDQRSSVGVCVFYCLRVCISHLNQDQLALGGKGVHDDSKVPSSIFTCGFVISPRLYKNLCTLLETSNCVLWLLRTVFAILDVENNCLEKYFSLCWLLKEKSRQKPNQ